MKTQGKKSWKYGKIEARIAVPSFNGAWPAFWMLGDNIGSVGWPACGEIDIMEHVNSGDADFGTIHWDNGGHQQYSNQTNVNGGITGYHTYSVEWDANAIKWLVDGNQFAIANISNGINGTEEFQKSFFILLNFAVGGQWPGYNIDNNAFPSNMYIDYVRVFQDNGTPPPPLIPASTDVVTVYKDCNYGGFSGGLTIGDYNLARLKSLGVQDDDISSLRITQGYQAILFQDDNFSGGSTVINSDNACLNTTWNDKVTSVRIIANGVTNLAGTYYLNNRNSGLNMDVAGGTGATGDGANVQQWNVAKTTNQQFNFEHLGDGTYKISAVHSGKVLDVAGINKANGTNVQQWTYYGTPNQQFIVVDAGEGYYKLIAKHSGRIVEVAGASTSLEANVQQWDNNNQTCGMWKLVKPIASSTGIITTYDDCNYTGFSGGLSVGDYKLSDLQAIGIDNDAISSLRITEGFVAILFQDDNFSGGSTVINSDNTCLNSTWNNKVSSIRIQTNGVTNLAGTYYLNNRNSGLNMDVTGGTGALADGANIQQWKVATTTNQQFKFEHIGNGTYKISAISSGKVLDVDGIKKENGANVQQWTYFGSFNQQFVAVSTGDGYYKLVAKHSGRIVEVAGASTSLEANVQQWDNNNQTCGMWKLVAITTTNPVNLAPSVNITSPSNNTSYNAPAGIVITANASDADGNVTKVEFYSGGTKLGEAVSAPYSFTWSNVGTGSYSISAKAFDNQNATTTSGAITVKVNTVTQVNQAPSVSLTSPANNATYNAPATINISANASDADGSITKVEFYNGGTKLGEDVSAPYSFTWSNVAAGTYTITAKAFDNSNANTTSGFVTINVNTVVVSDPCSGITSYTENNGYVAGSKVKNAGKQFECKEWPYSGWCNGASWAYAPGVGAYWQDAWYERGTCNARTAADENVTSANTTTEINVAPNPAENVLDISSDLDLSTAQVIITDISGRTLINSSNSDSSIDISNLSSGMYTITIITNDNNKSTKRFIKK